MYFNLIKEIVRLRKEITSLLSKGMSNIYLKITIEKNRCFQNFTQKICHQVSFWRDLTHADITEF